MGSCRPRATAGRPRRPATQRRVQGQRTQRPGRLPDEPWPDGSPGCPLPAQARFASFGPWTRGRSTLRLGGSFVGLSFGDRVEVCKGGLAFSNPDRAVWEAAAAVPFTAFCAAALVPEQTARKAPGYRVMGLPGRAPRGYRAFSYRKRLSRERTRRGYLK